MTAMIDISNAEKTFTMHLQGGVELPVVRVEDADVADEPPELAGFGRAGEQHHVRARPVGAQQGGGDIERARRQLDVVVGVLDLRMEVVDP